MVRETTAREVIDDEAIVADESVAGEGVGEESAPEVATGASDEDQDAFSVDVEDIQSETVVEAAGEPGAEAEAEVTP